MLKLTALCSKVISGRFKTGRFKTVRDENRNCFRRMNKSERLCHICKSGDIEDETHFISVCSKYEIHRTVLFSQALAANNEFQDLCNNEKLVYLMRNEIKALSTFLQEAWKIRQDSLYV